MVIVPRTSLLFEKALKRYQDMTDRSWSLTDCASFRIMEEERLTFALTPDRHFAPSRISGTTSAQSKLLRVSGVVKTAPIDDIELDASWSRTLVFESFECRRLNTMESKPFRRAGAAEFGVGREPFAHS
jgi:hypothetical protein